MLIRPELKTLTPSEERELNDLLKHPALRRWLELLEQDTVMDSLQAGALFNNPPDVVKAKQAYVAGKLEILNVMGEALKRVEKIKD